MHHPLFDDTAAQIVADLSSGGPLPEKMRPAMPRLCPFAAMTRLLEINLQNLGTNIRMEKEPVWLNPERYVDNKNLRAWRYFIADLPRADFDFASAAFSPERHYLRPKEAEEGIKLLIARRDIVLGAALMLGSVAGHGNDMAGRFPATELISMQFARISSAATTWDALFLLPMAIVLQHRGAAGPITEETVLKALDWMKRAGCFNGVFDGNLRQCAADELVTRLATAKLFPGTLREKMAFLAYIEKAQEIINDHLGWRAVSKRLQSGCRAAQGDILAWNTDPGSVAEEWPKLDPEWRAPWKKRAAPASAPEAKPA